MNIAANKLTWAALTKNYSMRSIRKLDFTSQALLMRISTVFIATGFYFLAFVFLFQSVGREIALLAILPVVTIGWLFRRWMGLLAGVMAIGLNAGLFWLVGVPFFESLTYLSGPASFIFIIVGGIVGRSRELLDQVKAQTKTLEHEIDERHQVEEALQKAIVRAEAANLAKSDFVSFVSHELRAPISAILFSKELLVSRGANGLNENQLNLVKTIDKSAQRMLSLVSDLTDVSRIETGQLHLDRQSVSLKEAIMDIAQTFHPQIEKKKQSLGINVPENLPPLWCDRIRLVQVLTNLVSNAHKYTPAGGHINILAVPYVSHNGSNGSGDFIRITVEDNGIGIEKEDQDMVFEKFFRADSEASQEPGTGLGLTITRNLVEMQNGRIWFESEFNQGTTFHFTLPIKGDVHRTSRNLKKPKL